MPVVCVQLQFNIHFQKEFLPDPQFGRLSDYAGLVYYLHSMCTTHTIDQQSE